MLNILLQQKIYEVDNWIAKKGMCMRSTKKTLSLEFFSQHKADIAECQPEI